MLFDILKSKLVLNYLPYIGSILIFLGVIRQIFFYAGFGISIVNYLDFSEIITSFLDLVFLMVFALLLVIIQSFLKLGNSEIKNKINIKEELIKQNRNFRVITLYFKYFKEYFIITSLVFSSCFLYDYYNNNIEIIDFLSRLIFILIMPIPFILSIEFERKHEKYETKIEFRRLIRVVLNSLVVILIISFYSIYQIYNIKINHSTEGTIIELNNNQTLKSNKNIYYVGKSNNFIFIHNSKEKVTTVIPIGQVKAMTFKSKNKYFFF
jgi:hypothetical protein